jgi:hypothetical protein
MHNSGTDEKARALNKALAASVPGPTRLARRFASGDPPAKGIAWPDSPPDRSSSPLFPTR